MPLSQDRYSPCLVVKLTKASRHPGALMKDQVERIEASCKFRWVVEVWAFGDFGPLRPDS